MFSRVEINSLCGGFAYGQMLFEDGTAVPVQYTLEAYYQLCEIGFFQNDPNIPPSGKAEQEGQDPLNLSEVWYTEETINATRLEKASGQRIF